MNLSTQALVMLIEDQLIFPPNDLQRDALIESVARAQGEGLNVEGAMRTLASSGARFDLQAVFGALKPRSTGVNVPYHLPNCRCKGTGWVDHRKDGSLLPEADLPEVGGHVERCAGGPITAAVFAAWQQDNPEPSPRTKERSNA